MKFINTAPAAELPETHLVADGKKRLAQLSSHLVQHRGGSATRLSPPCSSLCAAGSGAGSGTARASLHGAQANDAQVSAASELAAHGFAPVRSGAVRTALRELGEKGYTVLVDMMDRDHLEQLRERFEQLSAIEGRLGGIEVLPLPRQQQLLEDTGAEGPNVGVRRLGDLVNKGECFDRIWQNEVLLSIVMGVLPGPFKLHSLNGHDPKPGPDCAAFFRSRCSESSYGSVDLGVLKAGSWELSIATLLLLRKERGWLVNGWWQGTSNSTPLAWSPLLDKDVGLPTEASCAEDVQHPGVFSRRWSVGEVRLDCADLSIILPADRQG